LLVIDRLTPADDQPHTYHSRWHFNTDAATVSPDNLLAVISQDAGQPNLAVIAADTPGLSAQVITGQEQPEWAGWKSYGQVQGNHLPAPIAEYHWQTAGTHRIVTLLYPTPAGATCPVVRVETAGDSIRFLLRDGGVVELNESNYS